MSLPRRMFQSYLRDHPAVPAFRNNLLTLDQTLPQACIKFKFLFVRWGKGRGELK